MPADTLDATKFPTFSYFCKLIPHCRPTHRCYVVGDYLRKIAKEKGQKERKKERKENVVCYLN
jgi:hypothetical protein